MALEKAFNRHQKRYGTRRLRVELREEGHRVGRQRLRTAMRARGLRALQPRAFTPRTTDSTHGLRCAPNRLLDQPAPTHANQVWVSDITYLPLASGEWAYLCVFQDSFTRQVVGWQVRETMPEELVLSALRRALLARTPAAGLLAHSDQGGQYCGNAYRAWVPALTKSTGRVPGQCAGRELVVAAQNRRVRSPRVACFPRLSRCPAERGHVF